MNRTQALAVGTRVMDRDGFRGTICKVTEHEGSRWYDVRIWDGNRLVGETVRYDADLTADPAPRALLRCDEDSPLVSSKRDISKFQG